MTDRFRKLTRWLPVVLSMFGLLWGGCRSVEPVYQDVPASSDTREADIYADTHVYFGSHPRFFFVGGQVKQPGPKAYLGKTTVTTAIQTAGDFTDFANKKKVVLLRSDGRREIIDVVDLLKAIDPPNDPPVYPGDRIEVPRKGWRF